MKPEPGSEIRGKTLNILSQVAWKLATRFVLFFLVFYSYFSIFHLHSGRLPSKQSCFHLMFCSVLSCWVWNSDFSGHWWWGLWCADVWYKWVFREVVFSVYTSTTIFLFQFFKSTTDITTISSCYHHYYHCPTVFVLLCVVWWSLTKTQMIF